MNPLINGTVLGAVSALLTDLFVEHVDQKLPLLATLMDERNFVGRHAPMTGGLIPSSGSLLRFASRYTALPLLIGGVAGVINSLVTGDRDSLKTDFIRGATLSVTGQIVTGRLYTLRKESLTVRDFIRHGERFDSKEIRMARHRSLRRFRGGTMLVSVMVFYALEQGIEKFFQLPS